MIQNKLCIKSAPWRAWTADLCIISTPLYHWAKGAVCITMLRTLLITELVLLRCWIVGCFVFELRMVCLRCGGRWEGGVRFRSVYQQGLLAWTLLSSNPKSQQRDLRTSYGGVRLDNFLLCITVSDVAECTFSKFYRWFQAKVNRRRTSSKAEPKPLRKPNYWPSR